MLGEITLDRCVGNLPQLEITHAVRFDEIKLQMLLKLIRHPRFVRIARRSRPGSVLPVLVLPIVVRVRRVGPSVVRLAAPHDVGLLYAAVLGVLLDLLPLVLRVDQFVVVVRFGSAAASFVRPAALVLGAGVALALRPSPAVLPS